MATFRLDERDAKFVIFEQIGTDRLFQLPRFKDFSSDDFESILTEARKFATDVLAPLNTVADKEGVKFKDGVVHFPTGFREAYNAYCENGWTGLGGNPEFGGMGMPYLMGVACGEFFTSACCSFTLTPGLTFGVARLLEHFGTEQMKTQYLQNITTGTWAGTMCLTEPGAGSAVGDLSTTAVPQGDGTYKITGTKLFISSGDHDLTDNIIHCVLARVKGAPKGIKGVSLFIIPKFRVNADGSPGQFNDVACGGIEHKMGLHGSATCLLNFGEKDECIGYLLGQENNGIRYMFQMMNEARISVGLQGLACGSRAYEMALGFAKERIQGTRITDFKDVNAPRVAIIEHPDVRRLLMFQKAAIEGMRSLLYSAAYSYDLNEHSDDPAERDKCRMLVELLTPVCKAYCSDMGFKLTDYALQVHGGYGYIREYEVEQVMRDSKIATIYEGTNGIQALDLVGRKLKQEGGMLFMNFMMDLGNFVDTHAKHPVLAGNVARLNEAKDTLAEVTIALGEKAMSGDIEGSTLFASPYLEMFGEVTLSYFLLDGAVKAQEKLSAIYEQKGASTEAAQKALLGENSEAAFYYGRVQSAKFFTTYVLPGVKSKAEIFKSNDRSALDVVFP